ncbi:hypothetical protein [Nocardia cyriacigeorgica]|nr:hypothetical protein [Nocardia cyriacigeorgica]
MPTAMIAALECEDCSHPLDVDQEPVTTVDNEYLCRDCAAQLPHCDGCALHARDRQLTVDDTYLCSECLVGWSRCDDCSRRSPDIISIVSGGDVCLGCVTDYSTCDDCDAYANSLNETDGGRWVCANCEYDDYTDCADCDLLILRDETYCNRCRDDHSPDHDGIYRYDYKPTPVFHGEGPLFLGLEIEIKTPSDVLSDAAHTAVNQLGELAYLKQDGSISCGFELVTHPMAYDFARARFPWALLTDLRALGAYTDDNVGIHVHVSRTGFSSPAHAYRWLKFVYRNEDAVVRLARRRSDSWAMFCPNARSRALADAKGRSTITRRYQAINTLPEHTFELRVFASSLRPRQVLAALAFAAASVEYTRGLTAAEIARRRGWEWAAFTAWVRTRPQYSPLLAEMEALACAS